MPDDQSALSDMKQRVTNRLALRGLREGDGDETKRNTGF